MSNASILSIASHVPGKPYSTKEMLNSVSSYATDQFAEILQDLGVLHRHSIVEDYDSFLVGKKDRKLIATTTSMATEAAKKCFKNFNQAVDVGLLVAATNTPDRHLPCIGSELICTLRDYIPQDINIANLQGEGCAVLLKGVDIAKNYLAVHPNKHVLLVLSESNTGFIPKIKSDRYYSFRELKHIPHNAEKIKETLQFIAYFLFGDGAIAFLLGNGTSQPFFEAITHLTNTDPEDSELLTLNEGGIIRPAYEGFPNYYMDKKVPIKGAQYSKITVDQLMNRTQYPLTEPSHADVCFIHTGSKKILDRICEVLKLDPLSDKVSHSYNVLSRYGNLSSCSVGFMIEEYLNQTKKSAPLSASQAGLIVAFGIGFSASSGILGL